MNAGVQEAFERGKADCLGHRFDATATATVAGYEAGWDAAFLAKVDARRGKRGQKTLFPEGPAPVGTLSNQPNQPTTTK